MRLNAILNRRSVSETISFHVRLTMRKDSHAICEFFFFFFMGDSLIRQSAFPRHTPLLASSSPSREVLRSYNGILGTMAPARFLGCAPPVLLRAHDYYMALRRSRCIVGRTNSLVEKRKKEINTVYYMYTYMCNTH